MSGEHNSATQQNDEMFCADCGCRWEVGETPPPCIPRPDPASDHPDIIGVDRAAGPDITMLHVTETITLHGVVVEPGTYELRRVEE